jgi:hypothetical protein
MKRVRAQLSGFVPAVAVLFALNVAAPSTGFFYHQHAGGDRAHVHADSDSVIAELLAEYWHERAHALGIAHRDAQPAPRHDDLSSGAPGSAGAALTVDDGSGTGHWHQQDRFHRAVVLAAPFIAAVTAAAFAPLRAPAPVELLAALDLRARGPPLTPLS